MNRDETVALFEACEAKRAAALGAGKSEGEAHDAAKAHWNAWAQAMLARRKAMEADASWLAEREHGVGDIKPKNEATGAWLEAAGIDFSHCQFVGKDTVGEGEAATKVEKEAAPNVKVIRVQGDRIDFKGFVFPGRAQFDHAGFSCPVSFDGATFSAISLFNDSTFSGSATFEQVAFLEAASFSQATFSGDASFTAAIFSGMALFQSAIFSGFASFSRSTFSGYATFIRTSFCEMAFFASATFLDSASFLKARFSDTASLISATFSGDADFSGLVFPGDVQFQSANFGQRANFALARFQRSAQFEGIHFDGEVDFNAARSEGAFSLARCSFRGVPNFIQAHFEEAPRLDNIAVRGAIDAFLSKADKQKLRKLKRTPRALLIGLARPLEGIPPQSQWRNLPARWRALKRLAIQGHDTDRELEFHAREVQSQRFAGDWPVPFAFWRGKAWGGFFRFWLGIFYEIASDFGRSLARPLGFWLLAVVIGATVYVSQSPQIVTARHRQEAKSASMISAAASRAWHAWLSKRVPCYAGQPAPPKDKNGDTPVYVGALSPSLQSGTDVANEAWHLAFRNAFIVLDGSSEAAHRSYGCLYGVELYGGGNPLAVVPGAVSTASAIQKLVSALMIFLFGLALRNMLKMK
ncbi:MAG: pentapeptide repeat-containing protein [Rhodomicrobium sp.]